MTRNYAKKLKMPLHRLLCLGPTAQLQRQPEDQRNENIVYGLDGNQFMQRVQRKGQKPDNTLMASTGIPIRPLYLDPATGATKRAVPVDWDWGVDYLELRKIAPELC